MDDERQRLKRETEQGDEFVFRRLQAMNDRAGLSGADADYLLAFLDLCERAVGDVRNRSDYEAELKTLNEAYRSKVGSKTLKDTIQTLEAYDEGFREGENYGAWEASRNC